MPLPSWSIGLGDYRQIFSPPIAHNSGRVHIITDPPYLRAVDCSDRSGWCLRGRKQKGHLVGKRGYVMPYAGASSLTLRDLVNYAADVCTGWFVCFNDMPGSHLLTQLLKRRGATVAHAVWVKPPSIVPPRGHNLIPTKAFDILTVARWFKGQAEGKIIPGAYITDYGSPWDQYITGGKPLSLMLSVVSDYTDPGDLILEPFCGGATTVLACLQLGHPCQAAEIDPHMHGIGTHRIDQWVSDWEAGQGRIERLKGAPRRRRRVR